MIFTHETSVCLHQTIQTVVSLGAFQNWSDVADLLGLCLFCHFSLICVLLPWMSRLLKVFPLWSLSEYVHFNISNFVMLFISLLFSVVV